MRELQDIDLVRSLVGPNADRSLRSRDGKDYGKAFSLCSILEYRCLFGQIVGMRPSQESGTVRVNRDILTTIIRKQWDR